MKGTQNMEKITLTDAELAKFTAWQKQLKQNEFTVWYNGLTEYQQYQVDKWAIQDPWIKNGECKFHVDDEPSRLRVYIDVKNGTADNKAYTAFRKAIQTALEATYKIGGILVQCERTYGLIECSVYVETRGSYKLPKYAVKETVEPIIKKLARKHNIPLHKGVYTE